MFLERRRLFSTDVCAADVAPEDRRSSTGDALLCATAS